MPRKEKEPAVLSDAIKTETWPLEKILPYHGNPRKRSKKAVEKVAASIKAFGWRQPIVVDEKGIILVGHTRRDAAEMLKLATAPVHQALGLSPAQKKAYRIADNRTNEETSWDENLLGVELEELKGMNFDLTLTGFKLTDVGSYTRGIGAQGSKDAPDPQLERARELTAKWKVKVGQLWKIGKHRLMIGDCTQKAEVERLIGAPHVDCVLTDPPYCSGGFQEAGRGAGSIGSDAKVKREIANDRLSTRGYQALLKAALGATDIGAAYVFTDWRMWVNLFDVLESSGFGVRNMIVWDKGSPGMGQGWRTQHELIAFGSRASLKFDGHKAQGNVIQTTRTGNPLHPTQKPVELLEKILDVTDMCETFYDPFTGSGTTIVACEKAGRSARGMEIDPGFAAVTIERLSEMGLDPVKL